MFVRSALFACAAICATATAFAEAPAQTPCDQMSFRVYFSHGSAALDPSTRQMLRVAERNMAQCDYAAIRVAVDPSSSLSRQRGRAILAAANDRHWNDSRIEARSMMQRASANNGPEYAQVTMAPRPLPVGQPLPATEAGV